VIRLLRDTIDNDRYPLSPRIQTLRGILAKFRPEPPRQPLRPPPKPYAPARRAGGATGAKHLKSAPGPPMTLGNAARADVRFIVWCKECHRQVESDPAEQAQRYGAEMPVPEWRELVCSACGGRDVDMVVSGTDRR
jgi:hypothetical protein